MARHLGRVGVVAGRHRVRRLMRLMGMEAVYRRPRTSAANPKHRLYPYLLRDLEIGRPDPVWCADITYIPVSRGFFYLVAVMDWASRQGRSSRLANTMDGALCSTDGHGRHLDNIFIEHIVGSRFRFYDESRPHSSLGGRTPGEVYRGTLGKVA